MKKIIAAAGLVTWLAIAATAYAHSDHDGAKELNLPPEKKEILHHAMEQAKAENKPLFEQARQLHAELKAIVTAPEFDKDKFLAKTREIQDIKNKMHTNMDNAFVSVADKFTPEERGKILDRHHHHWHHDGGKGKTHKDSGKPTQDSVRDPS